MKDDIKTTVQFGDGPEIDITGIDLKDAARRMKNTPADKSVIEKVVSAAEDQIRHYVERYEQLDSEKADIADQQKELMAEAKATGYDTKVLRKVVALRKRKPDEVAEEEAIFDLYKRALGMR